MVLLPKNTTMQIVCLAVSQNQFCRDIHAACIAFERVQRLSLNRHLLTRVSTVSLAQRSLSRRNRSR